MTKEKAEHRGYTILAFIVVLFTVIAGGFKFKTWISNGTFEIAQGNNVVVAYVQDHQDTSRAFTVFASGRSKDIVTYFPSYVPNEKQEVTMLRLYVGGKNKGTYYSWVLPKPISISDHYGKFGLVADDSGVTDVVGYVREFTPTNANGTHYTIPVDNAIPNYFTLSLGRLPEEGDYINFWIVNVWFNKDSFWHIAILY